MTDHTRELNLDNYPRGPRADKGRCVGEWRREDVAHGEAYNHACANPCVVCVVETEEREWKVYVSNDTCPIAPPDCYHTMGMTISQSFPVAIRGEKSEIHTFYRNPK